MSALQLSRLIARRDNLRRQLGEVECQIERERNLHCDQIGLRARPSLDRFIANVRAGLVA